MRTTDEIASLLDELDTCSADSLEDQDLDFKAWDWHSRDNSVKMVISMAVCMANGGGGTVVFGVDNKAVGRSRAILGVPPEVDLNRLKKAVYDSTDPKLTPVFEELVVREGSGRLLLMQIHPGIPPYTDTTGRGTVRIGKDCQPLTGSLRRRVMVETGETDLTALEVPGDPRAHLSPAAVEALRRAARQERAPDELLQLSDLDLLEVLGVIHAGRMSKAGLLLAGREEAIRQHLRTYSWTHLRMASDTQYTDRLDGHQALPIALERLMDRIMANNPITTVQHGLFHFEYRTYPEIALREALMNALCHADYRLAGPILVKQYPGRIEISNPGGFIGGITPSNILHHQPVARNPHLVEALTRLRLVNRSSLGIARMFSALLVEGKEPPLIEEEGESVRLTFLAHEMSAPFRAFVADEGQRGRLLSVDQLLILHHLVRHREIDTATASRICQRSEPGMREVLRQMERDWGYLERAGRGRGTYWTLHPAIRRAITPAGAADREQRIDWETAKTRVLSILKQQAQRGDTGLSNADIRHITQLDRFQVIRLMRQLASEDPHVQGPGRGRNARYTYDTTEQRP